MRINIAQRRITRLLTISLFCILATGVSIPLLATAPTIGTTTFNGNFSGQQNIVSPSPSPQTATNVGDVTPSGWDITATANAPTTNVVISAVFGGQNPGGVGDFCLRGSSSGSPLMQILGVKSNDGSEFHLQTVYFRISTATTADMTITGYKNGVAVSGATLTVTSVASGVWTQFDVSAMNPFLNVDEFRFTQATGGLATIGQMSVDQITIAAPVILPLTLTGFSGIRTGNSIQLDWTTASEQNTAFFEVQRAANGADFTAVGQVQAAGNSTQTQHYQYSDEFAAAFSPSWFYRLKLADLDGRFTYSPVLRISTPAAGSSFSAYPNPFRQQLAITATAEDAGKAQLTIRDMSGRLRLRQDLTLQKGSNSFSLPSTARLGKGIYLLDIITSHGQQTLRVAKIE